ncbi:MAG: Fic family protein [Candidatus Magnetomorum sp.]|nr:Fic family protein [Candidatus Magnetomorum sp.]
MRTLNKNRLMKIKLPVSTSWLLGACMEYRGKQDLWIQQKPEVLEVLCEQAIIQSVESSNRIEGVTIPSNRLRPLILEKATPQDRPEEELAGYRRALDWIKTCRSDLKITPAVIQKLHEFSQDGFSGDAGQWKTKNNEIIEILSNGDQRIRFVPTTPQETPNAIDSLCKQYHLIKEDGQIPILLNIATFIFDLLCIHPFRDGNGRISRLVTTLLLKANNFNVGSYISLERLVEQTKVEYYDVLEKCSQGWHENINDIIPWWNYFLSTLRLAYKEFEQKIDSVNKQPVKTELVKKMILKQIGTFTLAELSAQLPSTSRQLIKKVLSDFKHLGKIRLIGKGRGACWEIVDS